MIEYRKLLDISEKFDTIDELKDCKMSYPYDGDDFNSTREYFEKMNELVKKIISNPKYTEKEPTLEDFFKK